MSTVHVLDASARDLLLQSVENELEETTRQLAAMSMRPGATIAGLRAHAACVSLEARRRDLCGLARVIEASTITCEHEGECASPTGCAPFGTGEARTA